MKKVAIVTDSTCCLPKELVDQYDIRIVPLMINYRGKSYRDGIDITANEVYDIMRSKDILPTTSTAPPGAFVEAYNELSQRAENILCITLTGRQSKTYESAVIAKDTVEPSSGGTKIEVLDSRSVAGGLGFVVLEAAREVEKGSGLPETINAARSVMGRVNFLAMLDTLYYLKRGGRIGKAAAWAGSILQIKPILELSPATSETVPVARPRNRAKAIERMLEIMSERVKGAVHVMVHHAGDPVEGEKLKETIGSTFKCEELYISEFTPIMGVHTGPGLLGISFYV